MTPKDPNCILREKPWYAVDLPHAVNAGLGMISYDERRLLYVLARDYFTGSGVMVDGGAYLGTSSLSLGFGLRDRRFPSSQIIHSFDSFIIDEPSVKLYFYEDQQSVRAGDNIRSFYEQNVKEVNEYIKIHEGDLLRKEWNDGPIEILFSDVSKSWELNDFIIRNWIASLIPEKGVLIQQDQVQEYHVWVAITMELLSDYFEVVDYTPFSSMVYRLKTSIPEKLIEKCQSKNISDDEREGYYLQFLEKFRKYGMGRYKGASLGMVEAGLVVLNGLHLGRLDKAHAHLRDCESRYAGEPDTMARLAAIKSVLPL